MELLGQEGVVMKIECKVWLGLLERLRELWWEESEEVRVWVVLGGEDF